MSVTFEDVAVYFSAEEWAELAAWQRRLYREVMMENYQEVAALGRLAAKPEIISKMEREETPCVPAPSAARQRHRTPEPAASGPRTRREAGGVPEGLPAPATPLPGTPKRGRRQQGGSARSRPARNRGGPSGHPRLHPPPAPWPLEKPPRACPECDASFRSGTALATHLRSHVGERPFGCPRCGTGFPSKGGLKRHQKTHVGKPDPPGPGASPGLPAKLPPSRRPHGPLAPRRPHACADCGEHFGQRRHPLSHQRAPAGERPVACARCPKAFGDKKTLAVPRRVTTAAASAARAVARSRT